MKVILTIIDAKIYAQTFFDSYNSIGSSNSYQHSAHPISLEVSLRFSLSGVSSMRMIPIAVSSPPTISFHHTQFPTHPGYQLDLSQRIFYLPE